MRWSTIRVTYLSCLNCSTVSLYLFLDYLLDVTFADLEAFTNYSITLTICSPYVDCLPIETVIFQTDKPCMLIQTVMHAGFFCWWSNKCLGSDFRGSKRNLTIGQSLTFRVFCQTYVLKFIKLWEIIKKIRNKMKNFPNF